jgi:hypothetical protein
VEVTVTPHKHDIEESFTASGLGWQYTVREITELTGSGVRSIAAELATQLLSIAPVSIGHDITDRVTQAASNM